MGKDSKIEWTHHTFNPWWGCMKVSPACDNCYAAAFDKRVGGDHWGPHAEYRTFGDKHWNEPLRWNQTAEKAGERQRVFCASMADVFDNRAPEGARQRLWELIRKTPWLDWLLLTKRPQNIKKMLPEDWGGGYANVWLGCTVENQEEADKRLYWLLDIPARIRFLSCEPLLGPVDLTRVIYPKLRQQHEYDPYIAYDVLRGHMIGPDDIGLPTVHWVICGGESGPGARPMNPDWALGLRDQCIAAGAAFHFKQWGDWVPYEQMGANGWTFTRQSKGKRYGVIEQGDFDKRKTMFEGREFETVYPFNTEHQTGPCLVRAGKKIAGRMLDRREWNEVPTPLVAQTLLKTT